MRNIILLFSLVFLQLIAIAQNCNPDISYTTPGFYPDSATNLPNAALNTLYNEVITTVIPLDSVFTNPVTGSPANVTIDSIVMGNIVGLPFGFNYSCSPPSCSFLGGQSGCFVINGTPTNTADVGVEFQLKLPLVGYSADVFSIAIPLDTISYYKIKITTATGNITTTSSSFSVAQNTPNPFHSTTQILYQTKKSGKVDFFVYDILGKEIFYTSYFAIVGDNKITFNVDNIPKGIYSYALRQNNTVITKKMIIVGQ